MALTTRRDVLKGIAGASVTTLARAALPGAAVALAGCGQNCFTLNVILHGLFLVDFRDKYIKLLAPDVDGHIYRAGSWDWNPKKIFPLGTSPYKLTGIHARSTPTPISSEFLLVAPKDKITNTYGHLKVLDAKARIKVDLPFPDEIVPLRVLKTCVLEGKDAPLFHAMGMSLCPVLIYRRATRNLRLENTDWAYCMNDKSNTANLHIWAEPEHRTDPKHDDMAYPALKELTDPQLEYGLIGASSPPIDCSVDVDGVQPYEEQGWAEWSSGAEGTRPVNCNPHILL